jgi:alpha-tubulin suppressor-like RCC1 family protein
LTTAGAVKCWGWNGYGQLGNPANNDPNPTPLDVPGLSSGVVAISAGDYHTCALTTAGAVKCWGGNQYAELGNPTNTDSDNPNPAPLQVTELTSGVAAISAGGLPPAGESHTCALTTGGAVKCWGNNNEGQLGNPTNAGIFYNSNPTPLQVTGLTSGVGAISAGDSHTCALTTGGAVKCWGDNGSGELGNPTNSGTSYNTPNPTPLQVTGLTSGVAAISAGNGYTCALTTAGAVKCWGSNHYGQLGNPTNSGTVNANPTPSDVSVLSSGIAAISAGSGHTCALTTAGTVKCWGWNDYGQLGNPTNTDTDNPNPTPLQVTGFEGA